MDFLKVFLGELKNIKKSKFLMIALIVVMLMPLAYGGLYLAAFWDPYGNTKQIPVAVVNLDRGTQRENKSYNFGNDLVNNLKDNDSLGWKFGETVEGAEEGIKGDKYFAMVVIPENFSKQLLDIEKGKVDKPNIIFKTNKKKNYIVGLITDKASLAIERGIREKASIKFTEVVMDSFDTVDEGFEKAADGSGLLKDGISTMKDSTPQLVDGVGKIADGSSDLSGGIGQLNEKVPQMVEGTQELKNGSEELKAGLSQLAQGINTLNSNDKGIPAIKNGVDQMKSQIMKQVSLELSGKDVSGGLNQLSSGIGQVSQVINANNLPISNELKQGLQTDIKNINSLNSTLGSFKSGNLSNESINNLLYLLSGGSQSSPVTVLNTAGKHLDSLSSQIQSIPNYSSVSSLVQLNESIKTLSTGAKTLDSGLSGMRTTMALYQGISTVSDSLGQATVGISELQSGANALYSGSETLSAGLGTLNDKTKELEEGVGKLYAGSKILTDGTSTLKSKTSELGEGVNKLYNGADELNTKLVDGHKELSDKLKIKDNDIENFVSDPVNMDNTPLFEVDKYGVGLMPNFVSLGLWMGALMLFFLINDKVDDELSNVKSSSVMLGKYMLCCGIGILQAILLSLFVMKLGLNPPSALSYIMFNIFLSFVFISISMTLVFLFGDIGRLCVVIILLLQLTSSGGTFPKELLPSFFQNINPILPFTYSISALKELALGVDKVVLRHDILILSLVLVTFLGLGTILKGRIDNFKAKL